MGEVLPIPDFGDLFTDLRGEDRTMRVSYHPERGAVVLSLWTLGSCRASFRLAVDDLPRLRALLAGIETAAAGAPPRDAGPAVPTAAAVEAAADQTGDIPGTAHRRALPAPRVA
ncbi:hypothetical protein AB0H57_25840 [Micromonospora sp. NPDC050686]|uniref:hypothetical protein n=1 Tax=Micromonospora sp. NPDC050686 TaxID=3154631 RepID=UPI0033C5880C